MSMKIKCNNHDLLLVIPQNDEEHVQLISQVTDLLTHLKNNPECKFREVLV